MLPRSNPTIVRPAVLKSDDRIPNSPSLFPILIPPFTVSINSQNANTGCDAITTKLKTPSRFPAREFSKLLRRGWMETMKEREGGESGADGVKPSAHVAKARACQRRESMRERERERGTVRGRYIWRASICRSPLI